MKNPNVSQEIESVITELLNACSQPQVIHGGTEEAFNITEADMRKQIAGPKDGEADPFYPAAVETLFAGMR
ncbi:MAG: hypothetical protein KDJ75_08330 [Alphaproteobacteria bacterium]|nr:hypothetical protein [Alphaproteobacteria bacterium]